MTPQETSPYGSHALDYFDAGWAVFPLPAAKKSPPPTGRTGRDGKNPTRSQVEAEARTNAAGNIGVRITPGLIGIDVDAYDDKPGAETLADLYGKLGVLPDTVISTSRTDGVSGIRFFRVPAGVEFITKMPGIEICQVHHRYAVVWPSIHDKTGEPYRWMESASGETLTAPPVVADLPELPPDWVEHLRADGESNTAKTNAAEFEVDQALAAWCADDGEPCSHIARSLMDVRAAAMRGDARHDTCIQGQLAIIRWAEAGHPGGRMAIAALRRWFFDAIGTDRDVTKEWRDGILGATRTVLADPTPDDRRGCMDTAPEDGDDDRAETPVLAEEEEEESAGLTRSRDGRIRLNVANRERVSRELRNMVGTGPLAGLFHRDGELVYTPRIGEAGYIPPADDGDDDGPAQVSIMSPVELKTIVEVRYSCGQGRNRTVTGGNGEETTERRWEPKMLPMEAANHVHTASRRMADVPNLRRLAGVTHTPLVRADGSILNRAGYDPGTRLLYLPIPGLVIPDVAASPTTADVAEAVALIKSIVAEFPFVSDHHRANWYGALFTPLMRVMLPPPYPAFVIDAPAPGSGKSYLAGILRTIHGGVFRAGWPTDDAEFGKSVLSTLTGTTAPVVTFDNVRGKIRSPKFEALLTSRQFTDRLLGVTRDASAPNDRLWTITANNAEIGGDLARRCYWITIDPRMPRPHERTGFALNLKVWPDQNRGRVIAALLTIVRAWVLAGSPAADQKRSDDYATWDAAMEGMLRWAGFDGQFGHVDESHLESDDDREWSVFLNEAFRVMGSREFKMPELVAKIKDGDGSSGNPFDGEEGGPDSIDPASLPGDLADKWSKMGFNSPAGFTRSIAAWVKHRAGRYAGDLSISVRGDAKKGNRYQITQWSQP